MPQRYTTPAIVLHWLIAAMIIVNVALAWIWDSLPDADVRPTINMHKSIGITVLGFAILRLLWRATHRPPEFPTSYQRWERRLSQGVHGLLYFLMFALPLTGWIMDSAWAKAAANPIHWFGLFDFPRIGAIMRLDPATKKQIHEGFGALHSLSAKLLYGLLALHVGGALKHQWLDRERELQRMWPGS